MELLINELLKMGANRLTLRSQVFGGNQVIGGMNTLNVASATPSSSGLSQDRAHIPSSARTCWTSIPARSASCRPASGPWSSACAHQAANLVAQDAQRPSASAPAATDRRQRKGPVLRVAHEQDPTGGGGRFRAVRSILTEIINNQPDMAALCGQRSFAGARDDPRTSTLT